MVHLSTKFLQLFLVLLALGTFDGVPWLEGEGNQGHGTYAAPTSGPHIGFAAPGDTSHADGDTSIASSAPASRRGSMYIRRSSFFEEDNASRRGSMLARRASVYDDEDNSRHGSLLPRRPSALAGDSGSRRGSLAARRPSLLAGEEIPRRNSLAARRASAFAEYDVAHRGSNSSGMNVALQHFDARDSSVHPQMNLQQQLNRANVKLANLRRRVVPSEQELEHALEVRKRSLGLHDSGDASSISPLDKRGSSSKVSSTSPRYPSTLGRAAAPPSHLDRNVSLAHERRARSSAIPRSRSALDLKAERKRGEDSETIERGVDNSLADAWQETVVEGEDESEDPLTEREVDDKPERPQLKRRQSSDSTLTKAGTPTASDTLGLAIEGNNIGYVANIQMGSQNKTFKMLIDSGSADTWVAGSKCTTCGTQTRKLTSKISSSLNTSNTAWSIRYGTGDVKGALASDTMSIAGMKLNTYTFGLASSESEDFVTAPFDGLMGLAQSKLSTSGNPTPIEALYKAKKISGPVVGYRLGDADQKTNTGQVTFGGVDSTQFNGTLVEIDNVSTEGFFQIPIQGVAVNGKYINSLASNRSSIMDTGTSLMVAPQSDAEAVHAQIPGAESDGQGGFTLPCNTTSILSFKFGGQEWPLLARDLIYDTVEGDYSSNSTGTCVSALGGGGIGEENVWLLGAAMLKRVYYATNAKDNVVGLGKLTNPGS